MNDIGWDLECAERSVRAAAEAVIEAGGDNGIDASDNGMKVLYDAIARQYDAIFALTLLVRRLVAERQDHNEGAGSGHQ